MVCIVLRSASTPRHQTNAGEGHVLSSLLLAPKNPHYLESPVSLGYGGLSPSLKAAGTRHLNLQHR